MIYLTQSLNAWGTPAFAAVFKAQVQQLDAEVLPLQQGLSQGGFAFSEELEVMLIDARATPSGVRVKAGLFYTGIVAGCSCADDPTPPNPSREYCEVLFDILAPDGETAIRLI